MRSPLGAVSNLPNQTYVTFNAGTYRTSHSDLDAMGMTMYSNGSTLLPTSGLYTYTEEPWLEYFHGTRSHNTVVVDGKDQAQGSAQAGSHGAAGGSTWASGVSGLYAGVHAPPYDRRPAPGPHARARRPRQRRQPHLRPDLAHGAGSRTCATAAQTHTSRMPPARQP